MRALAILTASILVATAAAQNYYIPDPSPAGTCNVIPFGSSSLGSWSDQKYQCKADAADLGGMPGLITGLGWAPCGTGSIHFDFLEVVVDHYPPGMPLTTNFAGNLTPNAVTVLSVSDYTWHITANTWVEIGLQDFFVYNGTDDVVVQVTQLGAITTGTTGFHRNTRQRVYSTSGSTASTGSTGNAALKFEVSMLMARLSTYGVGCAGSTGTALHTLGGSANPGGIVYADVAGALPGSATALLLGFTNAFPFPLDLGPYGMPGCFQYTDSLAVVLMTLDPAGAASFPFGIPNYAGLVGTKVYSQYGCLDPGVNNAGATSTNYGRIYIGN